MRKREDNIQPWIWSILLGLWVAFGVELILQLGFDWSGFWFWALPTVIFVSGCAMSTNKNQEVKIIEFIIYEYEQWSTKQQKYINYYYVDQKRLMASFVYTFHLKDYEDSMTLDQVESHIKYLVKEGWDSCNTFETKEDAMEIIAEIIKQLIKSDKKAGDIIIRNIKTSEVISFEDIKKQVEEGKFNKSE